MTLSDDARQPFTVKPLRRLWAEAMCLLYVFYPHPANDHTRKGATMLVVGVWAALEVGAAYGVATLPPEFFYIRLFVGILIGRMWGIQFNNIAGVTFTDDGRNSSSNDRPTGDDNGN